MRRLFELISYAAIAAVLICFTIFASMVIRDQYNIWQQRPVIHRQEFIDRPTTLEAEMAEMLGIYNVRVKQLIVAVNAGAKEVDRLERRVHDLEKYISDNALPIPADDKDGVIKLYLP